MKIFKIWIVLISIASLCLLQADDDYEKEHYKYLKHHSYKNLDYLDLSSSQSKQMREILVESKNIYQAFYKEKLAKEKELRELLQADSFDSEKYYSIKKYLVDKALELEVDKFSKIHTILTPKQRKRFSYFLEEWEVE